MAQRLSRAESREQTRRRLLAAAARLFARNGYQGTSVDEVAEAAGYSKGAFYYNFESKDELLQALITEHIAEVRASLERATAGAATLDAKIAAVQEAIARRRPREGETQLEFEVMTNAIRDPKIRRLVADAQRRMREAVAALIAEGFAAAGATPPMDPEHLALVLMAGAQGLAVAEAIEPGAVPPALLPQVLGLVLRSPPAS